MLINQQKYIKVEEPISRLDLLIKWQGQQERPSEITFKGEAMASQPTPYPTQWDKYYRRGTSEWISLEGVV